MRELNTIELNEVNGAWGIPTFVATHPYYTGLLFVTAVTGLAIAGHYYLGTFEEAPMTNANLGYVVDRVKKVN